MAGSGLMKGRDDVDHNIASDTDKWASIVVHILPIRSASLVADGVHLCLMGDLEGDGTTKVRDLGLGR